MRHRAAVLVIAGSDSSGGAGIVRDVRALHGLGVQPVCAITAVTAQTHGRLAAVHHIPAAVVRSQIGAALASGPVGAVKIGMLGTGETVRAVAASLPPAGALPIVLDPVLRSSSGGVLLDEEGEAEMRARLFARATLLTPNIPEAAALCAAPLARTREARLEQGHALLALGPQAVLLKGGHAEEAEAADLLLSAGGAQWLAAPRVSAHLRGTGCALASAIAAGLATGASLEEACRRAKQYVLSLLADASR